MKGVELIGVLVTIVIACHPTNKLNNPTMNDQETTVIGMARNGKGSAIIVTKEKVNYYISGMDSWESAVEGQEISVTGILTVEKVSAEDLKNEQGEWQQGVVGERKIITKARWQLIKK